MEMPDRAHRVVIVGGGFGGLNCAMELRKVPVEVTLIDRRNFHLFQPLLYQVATGGLSPANIAAPLRAVLRKHRNVRVLLGDVVGLDVAARRVVLADGLAVEYDTLVLATGSRHHYFGHPEWEANAPGLKTVEDATEIRRRVLFAFEAAERATDPDERRRWLTFVVVGGGPTGVELAGAVVELAKHTLRGNFRSIDPASARVVLIEGLDRVLPTFPPDLSAKALRSLEKMGVEVWLKAMITDVQPHQVTVKRGDATETLACGTVLWGAGVQASPLAGLAGKATGATVDRAGRVAVGPDLTIAGHPELFVIGDMAAANGPDGKPLPGLGAVAMQQGAYVARRIARRLAGDTSPPRSFRYHDKGTMATIGRNAAVAELHWLHLTGWFAWVAWLFIHLILLIQFQNRILVLVQWAWNYVTRNRAARLITGTPVIPESAGPGQAAACGH
jgi:NADH dehydrogenase